MDVNRKILENGDIIWMDKQPGNDVSIDISIPYGHAHQVPEAHFLEHLSFKSNPYRSAEDISYELEGKAIRYKAWTLVDRMVFHMLSPSEHVETALQILYECFSNVSFDSNEIELEKKVLISELSQLRADPYYSIENKMRTALFPNHPLKIEEETRENIEELEIKRLIKSKQDFFISSKASMGIAGNFDHPTIEKQIEETFGQLSLKGDKQKKFPFQKPTFQEEVEKREDIDSGAIIIAFPTVGIEHQDSFTLDIISHILGGSRGEHLFSNRLFQEIRAKKGLAYEVNSLYERYVGVSVFVLSASGIHPSNLEKTKEIILNELEKLKNDRISENELNRAKTNMLAGEYRYNHQTIRSMSGWLSLAGLYQIPWQFEYFKDKLQTIKPEHIQDIARKYITDQYFVGEVIPK